MVRTEKNSDDHLSTAQRHILREKGTEPAYSGKYYDHHERGMYFCASCGAELFSSENKFDSGSGWPSFDRSEDKSVDFHDDNAYGMKRTEVVCKRCKGHLGHVFDDGPTLTKKRYCINSLALDFKKTDTK